MKPVLQALVLAERIYEDKSGKKIIAGTFNAVRLDPAPVSSRQLPSGQEVQWIRGGTDLGSPAAYISLTDVVDGTLIGLQYVNVSRNEVLFRVQLKLHVQNRLETVEITAPLPPMNLFVREAGTFSLDVVWEGEILGSHRIRVMDARNSQKEDVK